MSRRVPTWAGLAAGAILIIGLAACGGGKKEAGGASSDAPPPAPTSPSATGGAQPAAPASGGSAEPSAPVPGTDDHVVVEVNGHPIRSKRIYGAIEQDKARRRAMGRALTAEEEPAHRAAALDAFVADELLYQAAKAAGVTPSDAELGEELKKARQGFKNEQEFQQFMREAGVTDAELKDEATRRSTVQKYVKSVTGNITISDAEAKAFYDQHKEAFQVGEQVRGAIIVVSVKPTDPEPLKNDARKRIDEARKRAAAGEDFAALAKQYSQIPNAAKGGDLDWFGREDNLFPKILDAAFATPEGQVSPVFETPTGLNIFKVTGKRPPRISSFDEVKVPLKADMSRAKEGQAVEAKLTELRSKAEVKVLDPAFQPRPPAPAPPAAGAPAGSGDNPSGH